MAFVIRRSTGLDPATAWASVTDLAAHTEHVPLTEVEVRGPELALGTEVVAVTRLGPLAVADRMLVTALRPGSRLRLVKTGWFLRGWADIEVRPTPGGAEVAWTEELWLPGLRTLTRPVGDRLGPRLFGTVVDGLLAGARTGGDRRRPEGGR